MTIAEQLKAQGSKAFEQGFAQGFAQGFEQGLARGQRQSLEKLMALKFGCLPDSVTASIRSADARLLDRWLERVLTSDTPDTVVQV